MSKEKIYFDTNCIAYLRSPEDYSGNEDINKFNKIFNKTFFNNVSTYCSTAHFMDLFNANKKFLKKDLDFLDNLSNHNFLFFDKLYNSIDLISPININDAFISHEDYKKHPEKLLYFSSDNILLNNFFIKTITESSKILKELNSFDIIKETEMNKILPFTSIIEAIISDKPLPQIPKEKINLYKEIRKIFIQYINKYKLGNNSLKNLTEEEIVENAIINVKIFLNNSPYLLKLLDICNEFDKYKLIFFILNLHKLDNEANKKTNYESLIADATHCYFARVCDYFITNDIGCKIKSQVAYRILWHARTQVIDIKQASKLFTSKSK